MLVLFDIGDSVERGFDTFFEWVPNLVGALVVLVIGYFVAKLLARIVDGLLERVGFDRWVERGALATALERSRFDASDIMATIVFWAAFLLALQLAFGVFGSNRVSDLIAGLIAYLPKLFAAVLILVITAAVAKVVTDLLGATLGAVAGGEWIARGAGIAILVVGIFAALNQLEIAPEIVNGLFYALLAIIVGSAVVAVGGGGIRTMSRYWERFAARAEQESGTIRDEAQGSGERIKQRAQERAEQVQPSSTSTETEDLGAVRSTQESDPSWSRNPDDRIVP